MSSDEEFDLGCGSDLQPANTPNGLLRVKVARGGRSIRRGRWLEHAAEHSLLQGASAGWTASGG